MLAPLRGWARAVGQYVHAHAAAILAIRIAAAAGLACWIWPDGSAGLARFW